jgi:signal peptidase I
MSDSLIEPYVLSPWAKGKRLTHCFIYRGPSMIPTFKTGDFLYLRPVSKKPVVGDVIVFADPGKNGFIVHRIVSDSPKGLNTQGDHNRYQDVAPVALNQIVGKVEFVENKRGLKPVANGRLGLWLVRVWQAISWLELLLRRIFWMPYQFVRKSGVVSRIWRPRIFKIQTQKADGLQYKYVYKRRTVATWDPVLGEFICNKLFDLVIPNPEELK